MRIRRTVIAAVAAIAATAGIVTPALAMESIEGKCYDQIGDWLWFEYHTSGRQGSCYNGSGTTSADMPSVTAMKAGKFSGWFRYQYVDGNRYTSTFRPFDSRPEIQGIVLIYEVHID